MRWKQALPSVTQDDRYRALIDDIFARASQLQLFEIPVTERIPRKVNSSDPHLVSRSLSKLHDVMPGPDKIYTSKVSSLGSFALDNTALATKLLSEWSLTNASTEQLACLLQNHNVVGGLNEPFDRISLNDLTSVDLVGHWGALLQTAIQSSPDDRYRLMFLFAPMTLSQHASIELLQVLIAYAILPELRTLEIPEWPSYIRFQFNEIPAAKDLADLMKDAHQPHEAEPRRQGELPGQLALARLSHEEACTHNCMQLAKSIVAQWPQVDVDVSKLLIIDPKFIDMDMALERALADWRRLAQNFQFSNYLEQVQHVLNEHTGSLNASTDDAILEDGFAPTVPDSYTFYRFRAVPDLQELLLNTNMMVTCLKRPFEVIKTSTSMKTWGPLQQLPNGTSQLPHEKRKTEDKQKVREQSRQPPNLRELWKIVECFQQKDSPSPIQHAYGRELKDSIEALGKRDSQPVLSLPPFNVTLAKQQIQASKQACDNALYAIDQALQAQDVRASWLKLCDLWPRISKIELFSQLRSTLKLSFGLGVREAIVDLGLRITSLQRFLRIEDASLRYKAQQLQEERINEGHLNWNPLEYTDWLLLEIDSDIMLRAEQVAVAQATITPATGRNSVVQLLMGKGKTSCILRKLLFTEMDQYPNMVK